MDVLDKVWRLELFKTGEHTVELNQIIIALLIIVVGIIFSRVIVHFIGKRLVTRANLHRNTAHVVQRILFYLLVTAVTLIALPMVGIPITIFTVLGGALAIGVGFGAQNLFNNVISGLIIMMERPIRIGDIVEVSEHTGKVEDIGNRCVHVRRIDGVDLLVPNSYFLEQPVVNWTLSDQKIRGHVSVGVAYGSNVQKVRELIEGVAKAHSDIHKEPVPMVIFSDFADSALIFDVYFWTGVTRPIDRLRIESDIRYAIDSVFTENDIVIAFPQLDVHVHNS